MTSTSLCTRLDACSTRVAVLKLFMCGFEVKEALGYLLKLCSRNTKVDVSVRLHFSNYCFIATALRHRRDTVMISMVCLESASACLVQSVAV